MSAMFKKTAPIIVGAILGSLGTIVVYNTMVDSAGGVAGDQVKSEEKKPLYWVAPMDPNYKRDEPGKSPMGMDLVPVYADEGGGAGAGPGTIRISPDVVNNLGVRTAVAERRQLEVEIRTVGYVQYDEDELVQINPRVQGWIENLYVKASGDPVTKGKPLYDIYSPELVNAQEELVIALGRKNTRLIKAAKDRLNALQVPQAAIEALESSRKVQQTVTFYAPKSGVVDNLSVRQGMFVTPGKSMMSIGILDHVWVEAEVFERQAAAIELYTPVTMTLDFLPGRIWQGKVDYIYPTLDAKTRTLRVRLRFNNENHALKPNMFAQVVIHATDTQKTLLVPREAVIRTGRSDRVVLSLGEGMFKSVNVKLGRVNETHAEILAGLDAGTRVVSSAQFLLDSESSKTSDFKRLDHSNISSAPTEVTVAATVNSVMINHGMLNVTHEPIDAWDWPTMVMDFYVADSIDLTRYSEGMAVDIKIRERANGSYEIVAIQSSSNDHANQ